MTVALKPVALLCLMLAAAAPGRPAVIDATVTGFDAGERAVLDHVIDFWERTIRDTFTVNVSISMLSLSGDHLGESFGFVAGPDGRPAAGGIRVDDRTDSLFPWFVDPTPELNEEFRPGYEEGHFLGIRPGPAGENYDLLTVLHHEMAHVFGFSIQYALFAARVEEGEFGLRNYAGSYFSAVLAPVYDGTHVSDGYYPYDLLGPIQTRAERKLPSGLDLAILSDAFGYDLASPDDEIVPEPRTISLAGPLAVGILLLARRRRQEHTCKKSWRI
jgi:hypothetical protein